MDKLKNSSIRENLIKKYITIRIPIVSFKFVPIKFIEMKDYKI